MEITTPFLKPCPNCGENLDATVPLPAEHWSGQCGKVHFHRSGHGAFIACGARPVGTVVSGNHSEDAQRVTCDVCKEVIAGRREWAPPEDAVDARAIDPQPGDCYVLRWNDVERESEQRHVRVRMTGMGEDKQLVGVTRFGDFTDCILTRAGFDDEFARCPAEKHDHQR